MAGGSGIGGDVDVTVEGNVVEDVWGVSLWVDGGGELLLVSSCWLRGRLGQRMHCRWRHLSGQT